MRGFKAFNSDLTCREFQYKIGETYTLDDPDSLEICESGFHFCPDIASCYRYYPTGKATRICEVEALGEIQKSSNDNKMVTNKIRVVREITGPEKQGNLTKQDGYCNTGESNTGDWNSGSYNAGSGNTGNWNAGSGNTGYCNAGYKNTGGYNDGDYNAGVWNTGDRNCGNYNAGNSNTGNHNTGNSNTGDHNYGNCNSGSYNTGMSNSGMGNAGDLNSGIHNDGDRNSGDWNSGCSNSGDYNSGDWNTGDWNTGNRNAGCFNTNLNPKINMFNKPSDWTIAKWELSEAKYVMLHLMSTQEDKQSRWDELSEKDKAVITSLPNFDAGIFEECTGIRVE